MSTPQLCRRYWWDIVCVSWGLRATDCMISVVAGPDDTGSIAPACTANGRAGPSTLARATRRYAQTCGRRADHPMLQHTAGSPRGLPDAPVLPLLACPGAASILRSHVIRRRRKLPRLPSRALALPQPVRAWSAKRHRRLLWAPPRRESINPPWSISRPRHARR